MNTSFTSVVEVAAVVVEAVVVEVDLEVVVVDLEVAAAAAVAADQEVLQAPAAQAQTEADQQVAPTLAALQPEAPVFSPPTVAVDTTAVVLPFPTDQVVVAPVVFSHSF